MNDVQDDILKEFKEESKGLLKTLSEILEEVEGDLEKAGDLEKYGQAVDRIMGGAKSIALSFEEGHLIHAIGDYSALCKAVGYKASQLKANEQFYNICVALLMDATEALDKMILSMGTTDNLNLKQLFNHTFLDRLRWVSDQFSEEYRSTVSSKGTQEKKMSQSEIDSLMKKLGVL